MNNKIPESLKILSIGNSFTSDTMQHLPEIAESLGVKEMRFGNLYVGGCSIDQHYRFLTNETTDYEYYLNTGGSEWKLIPQTKSSDAVKEADWDWIILQHGTGDGSFYTDEAYYAKLPYLAKRVRKLAPNARIGFNMSWVGESWFRHHEIVFYNGNVELMYSKLAEIAKGFVGSVEEIEIISPTGTAVQNARTSSLETLNRDGYHLSLDTGRYIAGLTFFAAFTGCDISDIAWAPEGTDELSRKIAIESVNNALKSPFSVTESAYK